VASKKRSRGLSVYSNLSNNRKSKKESASRARAEYLASLPKHPVKRFFYRLHPKRLWNYWFSKRGLFMALKIAGIALLVLVLFVGAMFAYFRKDLDAISPDELAKRVQTTVTTYEDRNGNVLWRDTGGGNYKLTVSSGDLSDYLKNATIAIEDKNFRKEGAISVTGLTRAAINNVTGGSTQGASTLTQQLVKQVFFSSEESNRGLTGIPRKIKEVIIAFEVDRTYTKDQILTMYLNESPYGGPRNGAESGAETYFGVSAKDLTLPEAALLAAIPQDPSYFNPYNTDGNAALLNRQHQVLDNMAAQGYISKQQATDAKNFPILDSLKPEADQYTDMQAPWFVQMVRQQLIQKLGASVVGQGGLTIKTTLDIRIQNELQKAMDNMFASSVPRVAGFDDAASTIEDSQTGQILALMGSKSWDTPGYGQTNAATSYIQPGSTIKPLVYAQLFQKKPNGQHNYGSGSKFNDTATAQIEQIYGSQLKDADGKDKGMMTVRNALAQSRNIPAVEAMYVNGVKPTINEIHAMGASSYCTQGSDVQVQLAAAIGGCGLKQVDLVNAYASLARGGIYKPQSDILSVTNSTGQTLMKWSDTSGTRVVDAQSAYIVSDILNDDTARTPLDGHHAKGMYIPGVPTATKTGTSDKNGFAKDIWMMSYSPALTMGVWFGNPDTSILKQGTSSLPGIIIADVMKYAHEDVYQPEGKWKENEWFTAPTGIQTVTQDGVKELYPSWWSKSQGQTNSTLTFDTVSKKLATTCTPSNAQISMGVTSATDPLTKKKAYISPAGYDATSNDTSHGTPPDCYTINGEPNAHPSGPGTLTVDTSGITFTGGSFAVTGIKASDGTVTGSGNTWTISGLKQGESVTITEQDSGSYNSQTTSATAS